MTKVQNIIIRLPNWLGDMVMSTSFVQAVAAKYPEASISLIAKKGIDFLLDYFPTSHNRYVFSKDEFKGLGGAFSFGKKIRVEKKFDLFFCLPDSFSSAMMAYGTGAQKRIGFKNEMRSLLMTDRFVKKKGIHRVEEYVNLLEQFTSLPVQVPPVRLINNASKKDGSLIININSEASSRRLPVSKAISIINAVREHTACEIILIGSPKEKAFVDAVFTALEEKKGIRNAAGSTSLPDLLALMGSASVILTTDSGPAHVANALGLYSIVLFGAGNEHNTAPYNKKNNEVIRLGELVCEPCTKNICTLYDLPKCLTLLSEQFIANAVAGKLEEQKN